MKAWTVEELEEIGQIERYGRIYYVREVFLLPKLLKIGRRENLIKRDRMWRFLYDDRIDVTVRNYCAHNDRERDICLSGNKKEAGDCRENNFYCKKFSFSPYAIQDKSERYSQ